MRASQQKEITFLGWSYRLTKFTPEVACFWATRLFGELIKQASSSRISASVLPEIVSGFINSLSSKKEDWALFQRDCLANVSVRFEAGWSPLVNSEGNFTQTDIAAPAVMMLITSSFMFSISDFFDQSVIEELPNLLGGLGVSLS